MLPLTPDGLLGSAVAMGADREALVDGTDRFSYGALAESVARVADLLAVSGVTPGDRVAHLARSSASHAILLFATARLGAMYVALDPWVRPAILDVLIRKTDPGTIVLGRTLRGRGFAEELTSSAWRLPESIRTIDATRGAWARAMTPTLPGQPSLERHDEARASRPHVMLFTSGTTGEPRGVVYSQGAFAEQAVMIDLGMALSPTDRFLNVYPPGHFGNVIPVLQTVAAGACLVQAGVPVPDSVVQIIQNERITVLVAVPALWRRLLDQPDATRHAMSSLRLANIGSDSVPPGLIELVMERTGALSLQGYGLTEAGLVTLLPPAEAQRRIGSAGLPLPFAAVSIRRPDGTPAAPMEEGEIWVRTAYGMSGTWDGSRVTPMERSPDGFMPTGDLGWQDGDHYLTVTGRAEDMLKVSGYRISATAVEEVLRAHPGCADAAVVALPSEDRGPVPVGIIVPRGTDTLRASELAACVASALQPQAAPVRFVTAERIPRTDGTGKVRRKDLLDQLLAGAFPPLP
jgi:acyl-coenzyme A synthetase/AMP-(fatty) acid ligase